MLLDSNIIIYSAKSEYGDLRIFLDENEYSVSSVSVIEVLGYHLLGDQEREYLIKFFDAASVLSITNSIVNEAVRLRQIRRMGLGDAIVAATALVNELSLVTRDVSDFTWIEGLELINPFDSPPDESSPDS